MTNKHKMGILLALAALLLLLAGAAQAQTSQPMSGAAGYDLFWWTVDSGGVVGAGTPGSYTLSGSMGQPDAATLSGGDYTLEGGFWGGIAVEYRLYLPLVLRNT